jgi:D-erythro-7,8-dihydroneopterin triphosphate epimerase
MFSKGYYMTYTKSSAIIKITNLHLSAIIGCNDWERIKKQQILINISMEFDPYPAIDRDDLNLTLDYRSIKKRIIAEVENSSFMLLEKLTNHILEIIMSNASVLSATVRVDKPKALRFADSVSVELSAKRTV